MSLPASAVGQLRYSHYLLPFLTAGVVSLLLAAYVARRSRVDVSNRTIAAMVVLMLAGSGWALGYAFQLASTEVTYIRAGMVVGFAASCVPAIAWVVIAAEYADLGSVFTRQRIALLSVEPLVAIPLVVTNEIHQLMWTRPVPVDLGTVVVTERTFGTAFWLHVTYHYVLIALGAAIFLRAFLTAEGDYRGQVLALFGMVLAPLLANAAFLGGYDVAARIDFSSAGFTVTCLLLVTAVFRYRFLDLSPVGYVTAVRNVEDLYVVVDQNHQLVDLNPAARRTFDVDTVPIGRPATDVLPFDPVSLTGEAATADRHLLTIETADGPRDYDVSVAPIEGDPGLGWSLVFRDVTVRRERARDLERKNDRLEGFASIVSHDLRNPIGVAKGHLELIETADERSEESKVHVENALSRIETIVEDTLLVLRTGDQLEEQRPVQLSSAARSAWETADTGEATLRVDDDWRFLADPSRLRNVLENLFRNAVEHGTATAVHVGPLADEEGFYVADDGTGIPADERDAVFDIGYTTDSTGTGLGLGIVDRIATAHGWHVEVAEGADGGARFEFTDVSAAADPASTP